MSTAPDIHRLLDFQRLLLKFSQIQRVVDRKQDADFINESDTEHSYNLALTAWYLAPHFPELSTDKLIRYSLVHDLVEIHAGDTYIYGPQEHLDTKQEREAAALKQLKEEWPDFSELIHDMEVYESREDEEAKFVYALDKIMPMMQIYINEGHTWKKEGVALSQLNNTKRTKVSVSPPIADYYEQLHTLLLGQPELFS
jgi:putative hydrolases of HD superfamily